ncbi:MAG: ATP-binding protein [Anaerolineae bacterium]
MNEADSAQAYLNTLEHQLQELQGFPEEQRRHMLSLVHLIRQQVLSLSQRERAYYSVLKACEDLATFEDMDQVILSTLQRAVELTKAERGYCILVRPQGEPAFAVSHRYPPGNTDQEPPSETIVHHVLKERRPLRTTNAEHDPRFQGSMSIANYHIRSVLCAPLSLQEEILGVLYLDTRQQVRQFNEIDLQAMEAMAFQTSAAVALARLISDLRTQNERLEKALCELDKAKHELTKVERLSMLGQVTAGIVHDLRGPMNTIKGYAGLLSNGDPNPAERRQLTGYILHAVDRLNSMCQELLDFARGEVTLSPRIVYVPELMKNLHILLQPEWEARGLHLEMDVDYAGPAVFDDGRLTRALMNIANNARDAMGPGGILRISVRVRENGLEFRLSDNGPGVPPAMRERLFEPFATFGKREGTGLGLAIARKIVEDHGGTIRLDERSAAGATFIITLPLECIPPEERPCR